MICRTVILGVCFSFIGIGVSGADDAEVGKFWGNFRGPDHSGVSTTAKPPSKWSDKENVAWKVELPGQGSSSPVVWDDKVFVTTAVNTDPSKEPAAENQRGRRNRRRRPSPESLTVHKFMVMCFDRSTGKKVWEDVAVEKKPIDGHHRDSGYASSSPVTDGTHVYFNFGSMGLFCYDTDGEQIWKRTDLGDMKMRGSFGEGSSVALTEKLLILPWDHEGQSKIEAINKKTGKTVWKTDRDEPSAWSTPVIVEVDGKKQIIHSGENYSRGYNIKNGEEIWRSSGLSTRPVATPVFNGKVGIFASSRRGSTLNAYYLDRKGDISSKPAWKINERTPDCPSLLLSENRLFYLAANTGILSCANSENGELFFGPERLDGIRGVYSSPVAANGKVFVTGRGGKTIVLKDSESFEQIEQNDIGERVDATLALVDDQIFIRGSKHLFCIQQNEK